MWGAKGLDRSETNFWNTTFKGDIDWDPKFSENFHLPANQKGALDICAKIPKME
jgi:hypothetical protein